MRRSAACLFSTLAVSLLTLGAVPDASAARVGAPARAPTGPALSVTPATGTGEAEEGAGATIQGASDPLVSNGLGSPLCRSVEPEADLSASARRDCATSGFIASAAPTANYGLDVHIDTGFLGLSHGGLMSALQDLLVTPLWMALVWVVHALCVMLEWCFTLNLLDSPVSGGVGRGLREMQHALTEPWIPTVLAVASVVVVYDGLVRRRVADILGQTLVMIAMMAAGLWAIADPSGTVGALSSWANEASLGTLAVAARGTPAGTSRALGESMQVVFSAAVEVPWCYLEFGNVRWCRDPARIEAPLRRAGLKIAAEETQLAAAGSGKDGALAQSARLLREAKSNGAFFLALPANGPQRNSINDEGSLLRTICRNSDATDCRGPAAAEAEFRTGGQTWSRLAGLLLIALGALGMILLLGFIALRLLSAALFSLFYLLIAPGMVLAPALGEGGRAVFRRWATHLLGAVVSKLLFSFLLGVVLAVLSILANLSLGWWTQWLLMSAFWWGAFMRRHQALAFAEGAVGRREVPRPREPRSLAAKVGGALESRKGMAVARWAKKKREDRHPAAGGPQPPSAAIATAGSIAGALGRQLGAAAHASPSSEDGERERLTDQLARVRDARFSASSAGDRRRAAELGARAARIEGELDAATSRSTDRVARPTAAEPDSGSHAGASASAVPRAERARRQDQLGADRPARERTASALERRRRPRLEIDREIELHRQRSGLVGGVPGPPSQAAAPSSPGVSGGRGDAGDASAAGPRSTGGRDAGQESSVMRDAREVAARRKRFLGTDQP